MSHKSLKDEAPRIFEYGARLAAAAMGSLAIAALFGDTSPAVVIALALYAGAAVLAAMWMQYQWLTAGWHVKTAVGLAIVASVLLIWDQASVDGDLPSTQATTEGSVSVAPSTTLPRELSAATTIGVATVTMPSTTEITTPSTTMVSPTEAELRDLGGQEIGVTIEVTDACMCTGIDKLGNLKVKPGIFSSGSSPELLDIGLGGTARPVLLVLGEPLGWETPWSATSGAPRQILTSNVDDVWAIPPNPDSRAELLYTEGSVKYYTFATHWPRSFDLEQNSVAYDDGVKTWNLVFSVPLDGGGFSDGFIIGNPGAAILGLGLVDDDGTLLAYQRFVDWNGWGSDPNQF